MCRPFEEVMGNCDYRKTIADGVYHCDYTNDDCAEKYCPAIGNPTRRLSKHSYYANGEPGDSQCPTCGSVVMSDEIKLPNEFVIGLIHGAIGAIACVAGLSLAVAFIPGLKQDIALYVMNHWI